MTIRTAALLAAALGVTGASATEDFDAPALDQQIDPDQEVASEPAVLEGGHVDMGPRYVDDEWTFLIHDDSADPPVWRHVDATALHVTDAALTSVPDDDAYAFVPAPAGADVHVVPQVQQPGVVWLGWNTQDPRVMETIDRGVTFRLRGVDGPGEMVMFLQSGDLGEPDAMWDSREQYPQDFWVEVNTHAHANWVFSEPGVYLVEIEIAADLVTGEQVSDTRALRFAVGDDTSGEEAIAAEHVPSETTADPTAGVSSADGAVSDEDGGVAPALSIAVAGGVALLAVVIVVLVRGRRARMRAAEPAGRAGDGE